MTTHRISEDVAGRLYKWMHANSKDQEYYVKTFNECLDELLRSVGF